MSTKMGFWRWALASVAILIATSPAGARVIDPTGLTTDEPTAIVEWPKLKVDLNTCQGGACSLTPDIACTSDDDCNGCNTGTGFCHLNSMVPCTLDSECPNAAVDTVLQLTNTSEFLTKVLCYYVNTNGHCSNSPDTICTDENFRSVCPLGGLCIPGWQETDFHLTLTKRQPISWSVNTGFNLVSGNNTLPCNNMPCQNGQLNSGSIPPVSEVPFTGKAICIEVDVATELPSDRNDFKGEGNIIKTVRADIDAGKYNAIGIKAIEGRQIDPPGVLNIGGPDAEYGVFNDTVPEPRFAGCPNVYTLNHFFDGADVFTHEFDVEGQVSSVLTLVPCEENFLLQAPSNVDITIQFLVFNEFEQRFSTSTKLNCYKEVRLSDIDTQPGPAGDSFSIFSVGVQGSITGMSRVRSVPGPNVDGYDGRGIHLLLTENWDSGICAEVTPPGSTAGSMPLASTILCNSNSDCPGSAPNCVNPFTSTTLANVQWQGSRPQGDRITVQVP